MPSTPPPVPLTDLASAVDGAVIVSALSSSLGVKGDVIVLADPVTSGQVAAAVVLAAAGLLLMRPFRSHPSREGRHDT